MQRAAADETPDVTPVVSILQELPDFDNYRTQFEDKGLKMVEVTRKTDGLKLEVLAWVGPSEDKAVKTTKGLTGRLYGRVAQGCPSGRQIGDEVWQSKPLNPSPDGALSSFRILARSGRSIVEVKIHADFERDEKKEVVRDKRGEVQTKIISAQDIRFAEDQAIKCLEKMTELGFIKG